MIKGLLKLGALLVVGIICYNYFLGTPEEKESSKRIFKTVGELGKSVGNLIQSERQKLDEGKYDGALDKISNLFDELKGKAGEKKEWLDRLDELDTERLRLKDKVDSDTILSDEQKTKMKEEMEKLLDKTKELVEEMDQ